MTNQKKLLIISAHADDSLSCAGTVMKLINEFKFVGHELVLTNSDQGQAFNSKKQISKQEVKSVRQLELLAANKFLGIKKTMNLGQPDLDLQENQNLLFQIVKVIRETQPSIVFIHNNYDAHPDHLVAHKLSVNALRLAATGLQIGSLGPKYRVPFVLCCEGMLTIQPEILVDISNYTSKKQELFKLFSSQASPQALLFEESLANVRGYHLRTGGKAAEGFSLQTIFPNLLFESI